MRAALDTNILVYAQRHGDQRRVSRALEILATLNIELVVSTQVIGELFNVLSRKFRLEPVAVRQAIESWSRTCEIVASPRQVMFRAMQLAMDHQFQIWDAFILESAVEAECQILLSEDMQHGFFWSGLTVINPFSDPVHPMLARALGSGPNI
jgi:predicted nucleic acid-binding protein